MNLLVIGLIVLGILSRLIIHIPNFTPIIAIALFGGVYFKNKKWAIAAPLILLAISDVLIGFHETMFFTWGSIVLISALGIVLRKVKSPISTIIFSLISSVLFFIVTNLGVWMVSGMYAHTLAGLSECFILAIPFFKYEVVSTILYTTVLFGVYEIVANTVLPKLVKEVN